MKKFVLLGKKTGKPLTLYVKANPSEAEFCGDTTVAFSTCEEYPVFAVDTLEKAQEALLFDTPWYNSDVESPSHDKIDMKDVEIAEMKVTFSKVRVKLPFVVDMLKCVSGLSADEGAANELLNRTDLKGDFVITVVEKGRYTLQEWQRHVGEVIWFDRFTKRELVGVVPARAKWKTSGIRLAEMAAFELVCRKVRLDG